MPVLTDLRAMTYNIQMFTREPSNENRIGDLLKETAWRPDFLVMQEGWLSNCTENIARRSGISRSQTHSKRPELFSIKVFGKRVEVDKPRIYGNGLSTLSQWIPLDWNRDYWDQANIYQFEVPKSADSGPVTKGFTWIRLQHPTQANAKIILYNLHGMADKVGPLNEKDLMGRIFGTLRLLGSVFNKLPSGSQLRLEAEEKAFKNFQKLANHVRDMSNKHPDHAILVGGDFNWRHRWRPSNARPSDGTIDEPGYNSFFKDRNINRFDPFGAMMDRAGLTDYEKALTGSYAHSTPVDRWFFKNGTNISITPKSTEYWDVGTPWATISDHNPFILKFDLTFP